MALDRATVESRKSQLLNASFERLVLYLARATFMRLLA